VQSQRGKYEEGLEGGGLVVGAGEEEIGVGCGKGLREEWNNGGIRYVRR